MPLDTTSTRSYRLKIRTQQGLKPISGGFARRTSVLCLTLFGLVLFGQALFGLSGSIAVPHALAAQTTIEFDRFEDTRIHFKPNAQHPELKPIPTRLHEFKYLGLIEGEGWPYVLGQGRPCADCLQDKAIYVIRADGKKSTHFVFPGRVIDRKKGELVFESRAFFGKCLSREKNDVYVVFQKERVGKKNRMKQSVFIAEVGKDHLNERLLERRYPNLKDTIKRVKAKQCQEIEGRNRHTLNKPLDLTPRPHTDEDETPDDEGQSPPDSPQSDPSETSPKTLGEPQES